MMQQKVIAKSALTAGDRAKALTQVRQLLKVVNFYARDRIIGIVLRRSILTTACHDLSREDSCWDSQKWDTTNEFFHSSFGVDRAIVGENLRFLELFS